MRYFLFTYAYSNGEMYGNGNINIISTGFPSQEWIKNDIRERHKDKVVKEISIMGWNEFKTEEDFNLFLGKE